MLQEALIKAAGPRTQTEIFVENWPDTDNYIYKSSNSQSFSIDSTKEWTQVFDLNDTALIVMVKNDQMLLKLMHLTEQPVNQYYKLVQTGQITMPQEAFAQNRLPTKRTEELDKEGLRTLFDKYSSAKIKVDGQIVQNLLMNQTLELQPGYKRYGFQIDQQRRTLSFITTSNQLYQIDFDRYYLKANDSVFIRSSELNELSGYIRAFDISFDYSYNQHVYIVGTSKPIYEKDLNNQKSLKDIQDSTLTFIRFDSGNFQPSYQQVRQDQNTYSGFASLIKKGIETIIGRAGNQIIGSQSKRVQPDMRQSSVNFAYEEGVVAIRSLTNGLVAVIYTSGVLKVWSIISGICLLQHEFFDSENDQEAKLKRIVDAKIQSISYPFIVDTQQKSIKIAVSYASQFEQQNKRWTVEQFNLQFTNLPTDQIDRVNEDSFDISSLEHELIPHTRVQIQHGSEVQDLVVEYNKRSSHIWLLVIRNDGTSVISDLMEPEELVYTRESQESYHQLFDKVNLSKDLQINVYSPYRQQMQKHYYQRLTVKGRFSSLTKKQMLQQFEFQLQDFTNYTLDQLLFKLCQQSDVQILQNALSQMIETEIQNQRAYGISAQFNDLPFRLVLRPVGISILKVDSYFNSLTSRVNILTANLYQSLQQQTDSLNYINAQNSESQDYQQFYELITSNNDNPLLILLASIQLLHADVLPQLDKQLRSTDSSKDNNIQDLILQAMRESYKYEILNNEILRIINSQQNTIVMQINQVIQCICGNLLENNATEGKERDVRQIVNHDDHQYSANIIRLIETGSQQEIQSLYQLLRDVLMVKTYINLNKPAIGSNVQSIYFDQEQQETLIFWLKQLASLNWLLTQSIDIRRITSSKRLPLIQKLLNVQSPLRRDNILNNQYQQQQVKQVPLSLYFLTFIPQTYQHSPLTQNFNQHFDLSLFNIQSNNLGNKQQLIGQVEPRSAMFPNILVSFIKKYMFKRNIQEQTFVPAIIRKLYSLEMFDLIDKYLRPLQNLNTIALDFLKAVISATHRQDPAQFLDHMCSCLAMYHHCINMGLKPECLHLVFQKKRRLQINQRINLVSDNEITRFYLTLLSQIENLDERYSLFVINSALMEEGIPSVVTFQQQQNKLSDKDYFYNRMFEVATVQNSTDSLYTACTQIQNKERKRVLIGEFLHLILQSNEKQHLLFSQYFFDQDQIDIGLDYLCTKVLDQLTSDKKRSISSQQTNIQKSTTMLIRDIHIISELYDRQEDIARFQWYLVSFIESRINEQYQNVEFASSYINLLELKEYVLIMLYQSAVYLGEHLFITQENDILDINKKRKSDQISGQKQVNQDIGSRATSDEIIMKEGYGVLTQLNQQYNQLKFKSGQIQQVTLSKILQEFYLTQGRIKVADLFNEKEADQLMRILVELKEYPLAVNIALAFELEVTYPLTLYVQSVVNHSNPEDREWQDEPYHFNDLVIVTPTSKNNKGEQLYQVEISSNRFTLKIKQLLSLAQGLISFQLELPLTLEQAIINQGHIKELVEFYISKEPQLRYEESLNIIHRNLPRSIEDLIVSDYKLLAKILRDSESFIEENQESAIEFQEQISQQKQIISYSTKNNADANLNTAQIRDSVLDDIDEFLGRDQLSQNKQDGVIQRDINNQIMQTNITTLHIITSLVESAQIAVNEIKSVLIQVLNK